ACAGRGRPCDGVPRHRARGHAAGGRVLPPRRHPPVRAQTVAGGRARAGVRPRRRPGREARAVQTKGPVRSPSMRVVAPAAFSCPGSRAGPCSPVVGRDQSGEGVPEVEVRPAVARPRPGDLPVVAPPTAVVEAAAGIVAAVPGLVLPREPAVQLLVLAPQLRVTAAMVVVAVPLRVLALEAPVQLLVLAAGTVVLLAPALVVAIAPADGSAGMAPPAALAAVVIVPAAIIPAPPVPPPPVPALTRRVPPEHDRCAPGVPAVVVVRQTRAAAGDLRVGRGGAAEHQRARESEQQDTHELPPGRWIGRRAWRQPPCRVPESAEEVVVLRGVTTVPGGSSPVRCGRWR